MQVTSRLEALQKVLERIMREGSLKACVVSSLEGFVVASAESPEIDKKVAAAIASFAFSAAKRTKSELGLGDLKDVLIRCREGKVVFKAVDVSPDESFILSAIIPPSTRYYNGIINTAAREIKNLFSK
ncbi:MAG: roadblock/LC7 domain-containing protein [Candidatus Jordarchaeaceae archaeon]